MRWLDTINDSMEMNLSKLQKMMKEKEPGVLQSMVSPIVRYNLATEQQQPFYILIFQISKSKRYNKDYYY